MQRNHYLDGLRGYSALAVALGHCVLLVAGKPVWALSVTTLAGASPNDLFARLLHVLFPADAAVMVFFTLSG